MLENEEKLKEALKWSLKQLEFLVIFRNGAAYIDGIELVGFKQKYDKFKELVAER